MRVVAILATYIEERFIGPCLENLFHQGIQAYLVDNDSTDRTVAIANRYLGRGLLAVERFPRDGIYRWSSLLERKAQIAATLEADWFMHVDADEIYPSPRPGITLTEALADIDAQGYNAVNFYQFAFVPTLESPDHDHPRFLETMKWYYPFIPTVPHLIRAWKRQSAPVDLAGSGGHTADFAGLNLYPQSLPMRHYHFLSVHHAIRKYVLKQYDPHEVRRGWHTWRATLRRDTIKLPSRADLNTYISDHELDASNPRTSHCFVLPPRAGASQWRESLRRLASRLKELV